VTETLTGSLLGGRYRVGALLGQGGMGAVYEGTQEGLDRRVALKVLHAHLANDKDLISRFKREAHAVAALGHPNVVQISDFQTGGADPPFLVMELLQGESLRDLLKRRGMLPPERVAYIFQQVLAALEAAHAKDIVHRDIKPDNVFLCATSVQADLVKILDFGVAKILRQEDPSIGKLTKNGFVVGTLSYMAPEQATGDPLDGRADLYSVGACMYLALTGRKPYDGPSTPAILKAILTEPHVPLAAVRQDIDLGLAAIVDRALAKKPAERFGSAREMAAALATFAKPTPLEPTASEAPTLPREDSPATVGPARRNVPSGAPTVDGKALARSAPTAALKAIPAPTISEKPTRPNADQRKTLVSQGTPPPAAAKTEALPAVESRMSSTPPPHSMGPETLATLQIGAVPPVDEPAPETEPPPAVGERNATVAAPASPLMTTVRSRTDPPPTAPIQNVSTTLKMRPAGPVESAAPSPEPAATRVDPRPVELTPARVQVPVAPRPATPARAPSPVPAGRATPPIVIATPRKPKRTSWTSILVITFVVLFGVALLALGVGLFALKWFADASPTITPAPEATPSVVTSAPVVVAPSVTVTSPTPTTTTSASLGKELETATNVPTATARTTTTAGPKPSTSAAANPPLGAPSTLASALASAAPGLLATATTLTTPAPTASASAKPAPSTTTVPNPFTGSAIPK
jgi:serine/threonine protein kinase